MASSRRAGAILFTTSLACVIVRHAIATTRSSEAAAWAGSGFFDAKSSRHSCTSGNMVGAVVTR